MLRKCRDHCGGARKAIEHRKAGPHDCTDKCRPHECKPLAPASIRQIHWTLSGALNRAVRWRWIAVNPTDQAEKPGMPQPNPHLPTAPEAARPLATGSSRQQVLDIGSLSSVGSWCFIG